MDIPHWDYSGDTSIADKYIRLTPDRQSKRGQLWNREPWNPTGKSAQKNTAPFEVHTRFEVSGQGTKLFGDGMAIWLTKQKGGTGPIFGNPDGFIGLGILFDTYSNLNQGHQQYISVILGDGKQAYDHDKDGGDAKLAGCEFNFRPASGHDYVDTRIVYDGFLLRMYVAMSDDPWEECFIVRKVKIPKGYYFGITAATGDLADNHDVISFKVIDPTPMSDEERADVQDRIDLDIGAGVDAEEHHDPQYNGPGVSRQADHVELPLWVTLSAIGCVAVLAGIVFFFTSRGAKTGSRH